MEGTVKWFNAAKGYGFIRDEGNRDIFVHHSDIRMSGYRELFEGQRVDFDVEQTERGPAAVNVTVLADAPSPSAEGRQ